MSDKKPGRTPGKTINGNKLFEGAKDGVPFKKGVPKTEEQRKAISKGMLDANARKRAYADLFAKITKNLGIKLDSDELTAKELTEALKPIIEALGDKVSRAELTGANGEPLGLQKIFITPEEQKETDKLIEQAYNEQ